MLLGDTAQHPKGRWPAGTSNPAVVLAVDLHPARLEGTARAL